MHCDILWFCCYYYKNFFEWQCKKAGLSIYCTYCVVKKSYWVHCICMYVSTGGLTSGLDSIRSSTPADTQKKAVEGLISRLLPLRSHQFNITIDSSIGPANRDTFIVRLNHLIVYISIYMHISAIFLFCKFIYQFCISHWCYTTILLGCMEPPLIANCFEMIFQLG